MIVSSCHASDPDVTAALEAQERPSSSVYVPMDSWIYPAFDRLAALGGIPTQISGLRPWTRAECLRQLREAEEMLGSRYEDAHSEAAPLLRALREALVDEAVKSSIVLESVSIRTGVIAGTPLNDSFHFGQTVANDFGRPFGNGLSGQVAAAVRASAGPFFGYLRTEYQHAPGRDGYPLHVRELISRLDGTPLRPAEAVERTDRMRPIEAYAGTRIGAFTISAGKQALWWGPTYDAPLSFSTNAEPTYNLRIATETIVPLPGPLIRFGGVRGEFVVGRLLGHSYTSGTWFNAQKLSFKLTENLEMGFTRWSLFWGVGHPMTIGSFLRNFTSTSSPNGPGGHGALDAGDRKAGFDFRYRIPGFRNWLTLYSDSYADDDPSPLAAPRRAALSPGLYLTRVPGVPKLDFRIEAASTTPMGVDKGGQFIYFNNQYRSGNTNSGMLLGNAVGRDGRAIQAWTTYHFAARKTLTAGYRQLKGSSRFLPGGSTQTQASLRGEWQLGRQWSAQAAVQAERYLVPALGGPRRNVTAWMALKWAWELHLLRAPHRTERDTR